jgi:hypothetical protein
MIPAFALRDRIRTRRQRWSLPEAGPEASP